MKTLEIIRTWDDREPIVLGWVVTPNRLRNADTDKIREDIDKLWEEFKAEKHDWSTEFIELLVENGYTIVDRDHEIIVLM